MDKEDFSKILLEQQEKGKTLLSLISNMHESQNDFGDGMAMFGGEDLYYVPEDELDEFTNKFSSWKSYVHELLVAQFGNDDQFVHDWDSNIGTYISKKEPILSQLKKKVNKGVSLLDSFMQRLIFHFHEDGYVEKALKQDNIVKTPKIFISHKSEDLPFVKELVRMLEFIVGSDGDKIFCSSISGYDIKPGREILSELKRQFDEHDIYFIVVHSPRYYYSPICLNEMGAAWVLGTRFCSLLTSDCSYNMLKGAIDNRYMSIKVNDEQETVVSKLNYFKDDLLEIFSIDKFNNNRWENVRNEFIDQTSKIEYNQLNEKNNVSANNHTEAKADIVAEVINTSPAIIDISNQGDSTAENLNVILDDACKDMIVTGLEHFPLEFLKKGKHVRLNWYRCFGDPDKFTISFTWREKGVAHSSKEIIIA